MRPTWIIVIALVLIIVVARRFIIPSLRAAKSTASPKRRLIKNRSYVALRGLTIASLKMYLQPHGAFLLAVLPDSVYRCLWIHLQRFKNYFQARSDQFGSNAAFKQICVHAYKRAGI